MKTYEIRVRVSENRDYIIRDVVQADSNEEAVRLHREANRNDGWSHAAYAVELR